MADFMHRFLPESRIWIPKPTWANHHKFALPLSGPHAAQCMYSAMHVHKSAQEVRPHWLQRGGYAGE